jgi:hypothetical protein
VHEQKRRPAIAVPADVQRRRGHGTILAAAL